MSLDQKMTALADEIRELSGSTSKIGIDAMTSNVSDANAEITEQADLITQIQTALEGKVSYNTIYIGSTEPTNDIGQDGDIYIIGEAVE